MSVQRTLDLLRAYGQRATFFVLGEVAEALPEVIKTILLDGHEVGGRGYTSCDVREADRGWIREDIVRGREVLESITGQQVQGYRAPRSWLRQADLWVLAHLSAAGYRYDSSLQLALRRYAAEPWRRFPHWLAFDGNPLLEVPVSSIDVFGLDLPIAGGSYLRLMPEGIMRQAVAHWDRNYGAPYVMSFRTWELDPAQPKITAAPLGARISQYRNLVLMPKLLEHYFSAYRFTSIRDYFELGLVVTPLTSAGRPSVATPGGPARAVRDRPDGTSDPGRALL